MRKEDLIKMVWNNVWRNKMRTILTIIAVAIGASSIILMISLAIGLKTNAEDEIRKQGNLLEINIYGKTQSNKSDALQKKDYENLKRIENVQAVLTTKHIRQGAKIKFGAYTTNAQVVGINVEEHRKVHQKMNRGSFIKDPKQGIVVSYGFLNNIYLERDFRKMEQGQLRGELKKQKIDPVNRFINLTFEKRTPEGTALTKNIRVRIDGVMEKPSNRWAGMESTIYMSQELADEIIKWTGNPFGEAEYMNLPKEVMEAEAKREFDNVVVHVNSLGNVDKVINELKEGSYGFWSIYQGLEEVKMVFMIIQIVLGGIGAIALVVASIGIVNTMVMSIMERTREIGIMKVVGANVPTVRKLFLMESGYIGFFGGLIGVLISLGISFLANVIFRVIFTDIVQNAEVMPQISIIPFWLLTFGLVFSFIIGILAGIYPANRAVRLSALDAIRKD